MLRSSPKQQGGNVIIIVLLVIIGIAFLLSCNSNKLPSSVSKILPGSKDDPKTVLVSHHNQKGNTTYTVQVAATTDRSRAHEIARAFIKDAYPNVRVEGERYGNNNAMYKVRIGKFQQQNKAKALQERILRAYQQNYRDSFVYSY